MIRAYALVFRSARHALIRGMSFKPLSQINNEDLLYDLKNFALRGQVDEAERIFSQIIGRKQPSIEAFNRMIYVYGMNGNLIKARRILDEMQEKFGVEPNADTYLEALRGLCLSEKLDDAITLFERMPSEKKNVQVYSLMIMECCAAKRLEDAKHMFSDMINRSLIPDNRTMNILVNRIIESQGAQEGLKLVDALSRVGGKASASILQTLITAFEGSKNGQEQIQKLRLQLDELPQEE
jgi:pentatricopeptide repeat protein